MNFIIPTIDSLIATIDSPICGEVRLVMAKP